MAIFYQRLIIHAMPFVRMAPIRKMLPNSVFNVHPPAPPARIRHFAYLVLQIGHISILSRIYAYLTVLLAISLIQQRLPVIVVILSV